MRDPPGDTFTKTRHAMGSFLLSTGRGIGVACVVSGLLFSGALLGLQPAVAVAQEYEAMLPNTLQHELRKVESDYREVIRAVNAAETERLARQAAGAAEADLRALDDKVGQLVTKAEKLKIQADYLKELYEAKKQEYKAQ
jgi:fructose-1-phosphate kinase PfkB-like protein